MKSAVEAATGRAVRTIAPGRRRRHQRRLQGPVRGRVLRLREDPPGRGDRASTRPRPRACAGSASRARCACPRCWACPTRCSCSTGSTRAPAATRPRSARASRRSTRRAPTTGARRRRAAPTRIGPLLLPNDPCPDWPTFYATRRLLPLLPEAGLSARGTRAVEAVCDRIADLAGPPEPPARLHGDLWSGNVLWDRAGPRVADRPGGVRRPPRGRPRDARSCSATPASTFFAAYDERFPLAPGWQDRVPLYQLFPLLVHAVLFGGGYARFGRARRVETLNEGAVALTKLARQGSDYAPVPDPGRAGDRCSLPCPARLGLRGGVACGLHGDPRSGAGSGTRRSCASRPTAACSWRARAGSSTSSTARATRRRRSSSTCAARSTTSGTAACSAWRSTPASPPAARTSTSLYAYDKAPNIDAAAALGRRAARRRPAPTADGCVDHRPAQPHQQHRRRDRADRGLLPAVPEPLGRLARLRPGRPAVRLLRRRRVVQLGRLRPGRQPGQPVRGPARRRR